MTRANMIRKIAAVDHCYTEIEVSEIVVMIERAGFTVIAAKPSREEIRSIADLAQRFRVKRLNGIIKGARRNARETSRLAEAEAVARLVRKPLITSQPEKA